MTKDENGSLLISFSFLLPVIILSILASLLFRYSLGNHFAQKQLCRETIVKHHWILAKASQKLIDTNGQIYRLRAKIALEIAKLGAHPSPAHKAKIMIRLNRLRKNLQNIAKKQDLIELKAQGTSRLHISRFKVKLKRSFCRGNSVLKRKCRVHIKPGFHQLLVNKTESLKGLGRTYSWDTRRRYSKPLSWINKITYIDPFIKKLGGLTNDPIRCQAQIGFKGEAPWRIYLKRARAS